ncbi:hypothetical protein M892_25345 [Vibrio campbellii ATCC BAA-1116]|uniref:Uncharacterized protein n=1 Tax=Vibrio campbellii (strain ATCC BAA-1116) TaxID=2902295 RepID=A7N2G8_VIBC1|nr:hypothetical protein VIBHAR_05190 [Vibrio campbellii ATCC BAA-1116]AGU98784.1 hypothetical protein M892_25345 [Vibrio campbellii ATCC BAA-1116]
MDRIASFQISKRKWKNNAPTEVKTIKLAPIVLNKFFVDNKPINIKIAPVTSTSPTKKHSGTFRRDKKSSIKNDGANEQIALVRELHT